MSQSKYIQDENIIVVFAILIFCAALILWTYSSDRKRDNKLAEKGERVDSYTKSLSWRVYIIAGIGLGIMIWELGRRIYKCLF